MGDWERMEGNIEVDEIKEDLNSFIGCTKLSVRNAPPLEIVYIFNVRGTWALAKIKLSETRGRRSCPRCSQQTSLHKSGPRSEGFLEIRRRRLSWSQWAS